MSLELNDAGFGLAEILVAIALITIGMVALVPGFQLAVGGVDIARRQSTGVFLAEQRLEQIKAWAASTAGGQGYGSITNGSPSTAPCCAAEAYSTIAGYADYRRQVNVSHGPTANTKTIQVQVFYTSATGAGFSTVESKVEVSTLVLRP